MFPTQALFYTAPFSDETLYMEQYTKVSFWYDELYIIANDRGDVVFPPKSGTMVLPHPLVYTV